MSAGLVIPKPVRVRYSETRGWFAEVPFPHPDAAILSAMAFTLKVNRDRLAGMVPGPRRDECARAVKTLADALAARQPIAQDVPSGKEVPIVYDIDARKAARLGGSRG